MDTVASLVDWLRAVHHRQSQRPCSTKALRVRAEKTLLDPHQPLILVDREVCSECWTAWPCAQWKTVAVGWSYLPGYQAAWLPR